MQLIFQCDKILYEDGHSRDRSLSILKNLILEPVIRNDSRILPIMLFILKKYKNNSTKGTKEILKILDIIANDLYSALKMIKNEFLISFLFESMKSNHELSIYAAQLLSSLSDHSEGKFKLRLNLLKLISKLFF